MDENKHQIFTDILFSLSPKLCLFVFNNIAIAVPLRPIQNQRLWVHNNEHKIQYSYKNKKIKDKRFFLKYNLFKPTTTTL